MNWRTWLLATVVAFPAAGVLQADTRKPPREDSSFGALKAVDPAEARKQAQAWLTSTRASAASLAKFRTIWETDRPLIDKVSATLELGSPEAVRLLKEARDPDAPAPTAVPALLKDRKKPAFYRSNLALAYAKALTSRKVYEEALESFAQVKPEDVVDPGSYFFHKAVCEHALMLK